MRKKKTNVKFVGLLTGDSTPTSALGSLFVYQGRIDAAIGGLAPRPLLGFARLNMVASIEIWTSYAKKYGIRDHQFQSLIVRQSLFLVLKAAFLASDPCTMCSVSLHKIESIRKATARTFT